MTIRFVRTAAVLSAAVLLSACNKTEQPAAATAPLTPTNAATPAPAQNLSMPLSKVAFASVSHNFGKVAEGEKVSHTYKFKNTGDAPLKITDVKPSCGCTTPDYTKTEIAPGAEGFVTVEYDSKGRPGAAHKTVDVFANTEPQVTTLAFDVEVTPAKQ